MVKEIIQDNGMRAVARQTMGDHVYEQLRDAIMRGRLPGGSELNQVEIAGQLGVSRVPVREALRRLQAEHLIEANPFHRYAVVTLPRDTVLELFDLRAELEVFASVRAVGRDDFHDSVDSIREAAGLLALDMGTDEWIAADMEFHRRIHGPETAVTTIIDEIRVRIYRYVHLAEPDVARREQVLEEHEGIIDALVRGDVEQVRNRVRAHVEHTRDRLAKAGWPDGAATEG